MPSQTALDRSNATLTYFTTSGPNSFVFLQVIIHCRQNEWLQFGSIPKTLSPGFIFSYTLSMQMPQVTSLLWRKELVSSPFTWVPEAAAAAAAPSSGALSEEFCRTHRNKVSQVGHVMA